MGALDTAAIKDGLTEIGKELAGSSFLTPDEKQKVRGWTEGMALAVIRAQASEGQDRKDALEEAAAYRKSFSTLLGVLELRAAGATEKALWKSVDLAVGVAVKAILFALA